MFTYDQMKKYAWVVVAAMATISFSLHTYQWVKGGGVGPVPEPPPIVVPTTNDPGVFDQATKEGRSMVLAGAGIPAARTKHDQRFATRVAIRIELHKRGLTRTDINDALELLDSDLGPKLLEQAVVNAEATTGKSITVPTRAIGDGSIINAVLDWFRSPEGQAVIAALVKLLLAALGL